MGGGRNLVTSGVKLILDKSDFDLKSIIDASAKADKAIDGIANSANRAERAIGGISGGVDLRITSNADEVIRQLDDLTNGKRDSVRLNVNDKAITNAQSAIDALSQSEDVTVAVDDTRVGTAQTAIDGLTQTETATVAVDDARVGTAQTAIDSLSQTETATVSVDMSRVDAALKDLSGRLTEVRNLAAIDIVLNLPANFGDIASKLASLPGVGTVADSGQAEALLTATSGALDPEELALAQELYRDNLTASIAEGAILINQLKGMGIASKDLQTVALSAFDVQAAYQAMGDDIGVVEAAQAQAALVTNNLARDYNEAADLIATAELQGMNRAGDLADSVVEYSDTFQSLGLNGRDALTMINQLMSAGIMNTDLASDAIREFDISLGTAASDPESAEAQALERLGLSNPKATGEKAGADFLAGVLTAIQGQSAADQPGLLTALIGTQTEDYGAAFSEVNLAVDDVFANIEGKAADVRTILSDNIGNAFEELFREINLAAGDVLSSEAINLPQKIEDIKAVAVKFSEALQGGATVGEGLEIALSLPGLEQRLLELQSGMGNFVIGMLQAVQAVLGALRKFDEADAIGREVARLGTGQAAYDLSIAQTPEQMTAAIDLAISRGSDFIGAITTASQEMFEGGDYRKAVELARAAADRFEGTGMDIIFEQQAQQMATALIGDFNTALAEGRGGDAFELASLIGDADMMRSAFELKEQLRASFDSAMATGDFSIAQSAAASLNDPIAMGMVEEWAAQLGAAVQSAIDTGDFDLAGQLASELGDPEILAEVDAARLAVENVGTAASNTANATSSAMTSGREATGLFAQEAKGDMEQVQQETNDTQSSISSATDLIEKDLAANNQAWDSWSQLAILAVDKLAERLIYVDTQLQGLNAKLGGAESTPAADTPGLAEGGAFVGTRRVGEEGEELFTASTPGSIINAANTGVLMRALSQIGVGGQTVYNNTNVILNSSATTNNPAVADRYGYKVGRSLRGFAG